jgi:hypothetical protein
MQGGTEWVCLGDRASDSFGNPEPRTPSARLEVVGQYR